MLLPNAELNDYFPSREEFDGYRARHTMVPVWTDVIADLETPVSAYMKLSGGGPSFLLESVEHGERWGRYSFIGLDPFLVMRSSDGELSWEGDVPSFATGDGPLEVLRSLLAGFDHPSLPFLPPFIGGAVGYLGYDVVGYLEDLPRTTTKDIDVPELLLMLPRSLVVFDHLRQRIMVISNVVGDDDYDSAIGRTEDLLERLGQPITYQPARTKQVEAELPPSTMTQESFEQAVMLAKEHIMAGDIFQVVLSHRFSAKLDADPFDLYRVLRLVNPSPYMFYVSHPEIVVTGSSPEPLVKVQGGKVTQRPIAGTRPRGKTDEEDDALASELIADEKERAEHVMLVDLARNDIGRVARYGSIEVEELMIVERYSHVMHLVSQVSGGLADGKSALDALYASFPAGTVSGAPKIRAMQIIDALEPTRRGPYAGVVGYFDFAGNLDTCIALRTAYVVDGQVHIQAGAGIVADSDPSKEWWETVNKARALLNAAAIASRL